MPDHIAKSDVTSRLRNAITSGRFMPNERLIEMDLATLLGTNRGAIRAALARLEHEGLVTSEPHRGCRVRLVSEQEALEITLARGALEALVARQAALFATFDDEKRLRSILSAMTAAVNAGDLILYSDLNGTLHEEIRRISRCVTIGKVLAGLDSQVIRYQFRGVLVAGRARASLAEHVAIVDAVCAGDPVLAEQVSRQHFDHVTEALAQVMKTSRGRPTHAL